jgi:hypothetical protein
LDAIVNPANHVELEGQEHRESNYLVAADTVFASLKCSNCVGKANCWASSSASGRRAADAFPCLRSNPTSFFFTALLD